MKMSTVSTYRIMNWFLEDGNEEEDDEDADWAEVLHHQNNVA